MYNLGIANHMKIVDLPKKYTMKGCMIFYQFKSYEDEYIRNLLGSRKYCKNHFSNTN